MRRFKNILVVCSGEPEDQSLLTRAADLADRNQARLTLMHVMESAQSDLARLFSGLPGTSGQELAESVVAERQDQVRDVAKGLDARGIPYELDFTDGAGFIEIIHRVQDHAHDLVIKMAGGIGMARLFPSQDMHLMRKCPCPVWLINGPDGSVPSRILAAVDPDPTDPVRDRLNSTILELATSMAVWCDADLDVLSVWRLPEESTLRHSRIKLPESEVDALVEQERRASEWRLTSLTGQFPEFAERMRVLHLKGLASETIADHATSNESDLIIMGTLARTGVPGLFIGNTAETVLSNARCSVLTIKPEGFQSPVPQKESS